MTYLTRRQLLVRGGQALGAMALLSRLPEMSAYADNGTDYKALVCIFLNGGNDAWNMVTPYDTAAYNTYFNARQGVALTRAQFDAVNAATGQTSVIAPPAQSGASFAMNPNLPHLRQLFGLQKVAVMCNVGTLSYPLTKATYANSPTKRPKSLFDHGIQTDTWQDMGGFDGWGNGLSTYLASFNSQATGGARLPMLINVTGGSSVYLAGTNPYITLPSGSNLNLTGFGSPITGNARYNALRNILNIRGTNPVVNAISDSTSKAIDDGKAASDALATAIGQDPTYPIPTTGLGRQMLQIAKIIEKRVELGSNRRQVFFASLGGFDTHDNQLTNHANLMKQLNDAMYTFYKATEKMGVQNNVTSFTLSEFGRTVQNSTTGTDHAWGSLSLVMGGDVKGGDFYGQYPSLVLGGANDVDSGTNSRGRILPTTSVDQYAGTFARWMGMQDAEINALLPNLARFAPADLGFMKPVV